jgi:hypothetical protein
MKEKETSPDKKLAYVFNLYIDLVFDVMDAALTHMVAFTTDFQLLIRKYHASMLRL